MTFQVPVYQPPGGSWQLIDYRPALVLTATADATGTATVTADQVPGGYMWAIQRAVCSSTSTGHPVLRLYDGDPTPGNLLSGSNSGGYDEADYPAGLGMLVDQGRQLTGRWTGCAPGDKCTLRLQVGVLAQVS